MRHGVDNLTFQKGDILLKLDSRGVYGKGTTRQHIMIVVGKKESYPIVAHMRIKSSPGGQALNIELLNRSRVKDLILVRYPWPPEFTNNLIDNIELAESNKCFYITEKRIQKQLIYHGEFSTNTNSPVQKKKAIINLNTRYQKYTPLVTELPTAEKINLTCHGFVLEILHLTFRQTETEIPPSLQIAPEDAWADFIRRNVLHFQQEEKIEIEYAIEITKHLNRLSDKEKKLECKHAGTQINKTISSKKKIKHSLGLFGKIKREFNHFIKSAPNKSPGPG